MLKLINHSIVFKYGMTIEKNEYRKFKLDFLLSQKIKFDRFLTLSANNLYFEEMVLSNDNLIGASIHSYELDAATYVMGGQRYQELLKKGYNIKYKHGDIFTANFSKYNVIDLDMCGELTTTFMNQLLVGLSKFESGVVFITFTKNARGSKIKEISELYGAANYQEFRDIKFAEYLEEMVGLKMVGTPYEYNNKSENPKATDMMLCIFMK